MTDSHAKRWDAEEPATKNEPAPVKPHRRVPPQPVVVVDFDMSFESLVKFMVKVVLAAIPAAIILSVIFAVISFVFMLMWKN